MDGYDPADNSAKCYDVAISHMRDKLASFRKEVIGECTLYLGDCREILPLLPAVDMVFTDPPYGHNNNNGDLIHNREAALGLSPSCGSSPRPIANDGAKETAELIEWFFAQLPKLLKPGCCCCCCCGGGGPDPQFARWSLELDRHIDFKQMVVWDKGPMGMGWHYRRSYEVVLVGQRQGAACEWHDTSGRIENIIRPGYLGIRKIIPQAVDHPTPKPPELARHFIRLHTTTEGTVLDPFMGGGSTGVAAVHEGRRFIGTEVDPQWFDLACRRIEEAYKQPDMFVQAPQPKAEQVDMLGLLGFGT
jgi:site-specific DNA-methyltransferase (adenine-specific)